jgi:hypothetical protein
MTSPRGESIPAGRSYQFWYERLSPDIDWRVAFYAWSDSTDPRSGPAAFRRILQRTPIAIQHTARLDYLWYTPTIKDIPRSHVAAVATRTLTLAEGNYTLRAISDDAVRVWVDGRLVIDDWSPHESAVDTAPLRGGRHDVRVEYYQVDGWTELRVDFVRGRQRPGGSPGPH